MNQSQSYKRFRSGTLASSFHFLSGPVRPTKSARRRRQVAAASTLCDPSFLYATDKATSLSGLTGPSHCLDELCRILKWNQENWRA